MILHKKIQEEIKEAMKAKDKMRLSVLRGLLSGFTNALVAQKRKPNEELSDKEALKVIHTAAKQRKDSIEQFGKGGREDLAKKEEGELKILEEYLPKKMSREEIEEIAKVRKEELRIFDATQTGQFMAVLMKEFGDTADGADVKVVVDSLLQ